MPVNESNVEKKTPVQMNLNVSVEIHDFVLERIARAVLRSEMEEGGKFLGSIEKEGQQIRIQVESYIDSGPRVQNSATHLYSDGDYQEIVFRLVEIFKPEIEHIGSWHSHHCNKLTDLSAGDIRGYFKSVNHPQYNLEHFFVLLVVGCSEGEVEFHYFLFCRGEDCYYEIEKSKVHVVQKASWVEPLLLKAEQVTLDYRERLHSGERPL
jgi:hypothetical protein